MIGFRFGFGFVSSSLPPPLFFLFDIFIMISLNAFLLKEENILLNICFTVIQQIQVSFCSRGFCELKSREVVACTVILSVTDDL